VNVSPSKEAPEPEKLKQLERLVAAARDLDPLATAREYVQEGVDPFAPEEPPGELALL
jgi:hypothetical protein